MKDEEGSSDNDNVYDQIDEEDDDQYESETVAVSATVPGANGHSGGICAIALYDYQAMADDEISFDPNDIITNIEMVSRSSY